MKKLGINIFILSLLCVSCTVQADDWSRVAYGLQYKIVEVPSERQIKPKLHVFRVNTRLNDIRPLLPADNKPKTIDKLTQEAGAILGINANFFDEKNNILGLVVKDGKEISPKKTISWWGIFYTYGKGYRIRHSTDIQNTRGIRQAIQAGPRLLVNGQIPPLKPNTSAKTAIGIDGQGQVYIIVTRFQIDINTLAQILQKSPDKGGLGLSQALNLDGGSSTQLYAKKDSFKLHLPGYVNVPVGLGVFKK